MRITTFLLISLATLLCVNISLAQVSVNQRFGNNLSRGYYTFGLNAGWAYQTSDVRIGKGGYGFGATLAKNLYYRNNAIFSFDLRGRLLFARTYGLDASRSYNIANNTALNGDYGLDYTDYPLQLEEPQGFVFQNHRTDIFELGLEGVLTFNRLRERTGVILSLFGGIGADWYRAKIDQADAGGQEYFEAYAALKDNLSDATTREALRDALDGTYETNADGFDDSTGKIGLMPSLGVELGYQLTPRFSVNLGHRVTFSGTDLLDGQRWAEPDKDLYHYTNFALRWIIQPDRDKPLAPVIEITTPITNPYTTNNPRDGIVRANIRNINSAADVTCTVNGNDSRFNYNDQRFSVDFSLRPGQNDIVIAASNRVGSARKEVTIYYEDRIINPPPAGRAPSVTILTPPTRTSRTANPNMTIRASVQEVTNKSDITVEFNGNNRQNFSFDSRTGELSTDVALREGENRIYVRARNTYGNAVEEAFVTYERERETTPLVTITRPDLERTETQQLNAIIEASVRRVSRADQVKMTLNGRQFRNFTFDASREQLRAEISLEQGNNFVEITASNAAGQSKDGVTIVYRSQGSPQNLPTISITEPGKPSTSTSKASVPVEATTQFVSQKSDVRFYINGRESNNFNFNPTTGRITSTVNLENGNNEVRIRVYNREGDAEASVSIRRLSGGDSNQPQGPEVTITQPADGASFEQATVDVRAKTVRVSGKENITFTLNGRAVSNFNFNRLSGEVTATVTLIEGNNVVRVTGRNDSGTDEATVNLRYRTATKKPEVSIVQPANNSTVTNATAALKATTQNVSAKSEVSVLLNGRAISNFSFDASRQEVTATVSLEGGNNVITVKVQNSGGSDEATANVRYSAPKQPDVVIVQPANNSTVTAASAALKATTQNVSAKSEVSVLLNGRAFNNFNFDASRQEITGTLTLESGNNVVTVKVQNSGGNDEATANVRYNNVKSPVVTITSPATAEHTSKEKNYTLRATIQHVSSKSDVTVKVNGQTQSNFTFATASGELTLPMTLESGANVVVVAARNSAGSDEKSVRINHRAAQLPVVDITAPQNNLAVATSTVTLKATVRYVNDKKGVVVSLNGKTIVDFTLNGENLTAEVTALKVGSNRIEVVAQNSDGKASDFVTIIYTQKAQAKPEVRFVQPAKAGSVSKQGTADIVAEVKNVAAKSDIVFKMGTAAVEDFEFNASTGQLKAQVNLAAGTNTLEIEGRNKSGSAKATTTIIYQRVASKVPVITIASVSQPTTNPLNPGIGRSTLIATISHVSSKDQVTFSVNGRTISDFTFNAKTGGFDCTFELERGENLVKLRAETPAGADEKTRTVNF